MSHIFCGKCPQCGGATWVPYGWFGIYPPQPACQRGCGLPGIGTSPTDFQKMLETYMSPPPCPGHPPKAAVPAPMTPEQKSEVQEKIEETRKIVEGIQQEQQSKEAQGLQSEKFAEMEKSIEKLENMMVLVAKALKEIKEALPPQPEKVETSVDVGNMTEKV